MIMPKVDKGKKAKRRMIDSVLRFFSEGGDAGDVMAGKKISPEQIMKELAAIGFARRMPVVEEQIKVINHRLTDLEREV